MTITTLEYQRPHFPSDLRYRIAEMVNETFPGTEASKDASLLDVFLPRIHYVDEGLALFNKSKDFVLGMKKENQTISDTLLYLRTIRPHNTQNFPASLQVSIRKLNERRTGFADQLYRKGVLSEEYLSAIKTIYMDLPEIIQCSRFFAAGVIHPLLEKDPELLAETFFNLEKVCTHNYHQHFDQHCHQLRIRGNTTRLFPTEDQGLVPTAVGEICWPTAYLDNNVVVQIQDFLPAILSESVDQLKSQYLGLQYNLVNDNFIKTLLEKAQVPLLAAWERLCEQIRLLLYLLDLHMSIQEDAATVQREFLLLQLNSEPDPALQTIILTKTKQLLEETETHGHGER